MSCFSGMPSWSCSRRTVSCDPMTVAPVCARDALGAPQVVEVRVADEHVVGAPHVGDGDADRRRRGHAVDVGVEEDRQIADDEAEGRDAEPVEGHAHADPIARSGARGSVFEREPSRRRSGSPRGGSAAERPRASPAHPSRSR